MRRTHDRMDHLMRQALDLARRVVEVAEDRDDLFVAGQTNLMDFAELANLDRLKQLFEAFTEKRQILHLLDRCIEAEGVQIFVGEESGYEVLGGCSLVGAPYHIDGKVIGVLGVIGPARMNYPRVIPIVDVTARLLGAALKHG
jgi:heat-inducible transcriptional repressor